jgi:aldehyde dehydrogenase (NAD+)
MTVAEAFKSMSYGPAPEAADHVTSWLLDHQESSKLFIDGAWVEPSSGEYFDSSNPATGEVLGRIAQADGNDIEKAVAAARKAQPAWEAIGGHSRARCLYAIARLMQRYSRPLAVLESMDNGKPIRESRDVDVPLAIRHFYHHAGWAELIATEMPEQQAVGVVGQVIPWNFPLLMAAWKIAPAIAAGNCVVLKPAEYTSLSALMFAELCQEAGVPAGVINIITGDGRTGAELVTHPDVDKVAFTGSTAVGRTIREQTAGSGKKLTLELGGKSPFIVFDDADQDGAVEGLVDAIWFNQGQVCCGGSRLLVQEGIADAMIEKIKARMEKLRIGDPLDKGIDIGAIVDHTQRDRIASMVQQGVDEGATLWQPPTPCPETGCFYPPTLLCDVETSNLVAQEEIFGPVLSVLTFRTQKEAIELANNTRYGLAASIWSENINRALDVAPQMKAGVIWINTTNQFDAACGFGGYRESGMGREGGAEGMYEYLKPAQNNAEEVGIPHPDASTEPGQSDSGQSDNGFIDRTAKMYIGGKQARPDGGNSLAIRSPAGEILGAVGDGNRKDIRNAVEAAHKARGWGKTTAHNRAQILFYIAENLSYRSEEFSARLSALTGASAEAAAQEVEQTIERLFYYAAWADKYDGRVHQPPIKGVALAMNEPIGVVAIGCPDSTPLLAFVSMLAPVIAMGNTAVVVPSQRFPLLATDFYQVLETSDLPAGVVNIVTGGRDELIKVCADHNQVDGLWYHGSAAGSEMVQRASTGNLKRTWVNNGRARDWTSSTEGCGKQFLREACQVKNIWIPYGDSV